MSSQTMGRDVLENKDKEQLVTIAQALGIKSVSRLKKAELVDRILEQTGPNDGPDAAPAAAATSPAGQRATPARASRAAAPTNNRVVLGPDGEPLADWEIDLMKSGETAAPAARTDADGDDSDGDDGDDGDDGSSSQGEGGAGRKRRRRRNRNRNRGDDGGAGEGGEAGAGEERQAGAERQPAGERQGGGDRQPVGDRQRQGEGPQQRDHRGKDRDRDRDRDRGRRGERGERDRFGPRDADAGVETEAPLSTEPVRVSGYLDLHDQGYGFLRVGGYLATREDAYISVRQTRQYGLRKGDFVEGMSRPAGRNEKNPGLAEIYTINGKDPDQLKGRPRFEDLTPLFPDTKLRLEDPSDPTNMTARIIDLISPIGMGQRGIIVSPPKAGKTTVMKTIANSIEKNNPNVKLIVLLIDERPEEVTDFRRTVKGEVIASTFDRPSDEHTHVAELVIEKAKRLVEMGEDVVIILDGITRLSRAYNLAAPATGRIMSGGIDAGALYPPKKFFGAARNVEEGGSLTILATALVETNSRMDEAIFEEF
ncbi:MAG: transcription termination factor Rho, partial [Actinobacteria bacterium]|nr:transcription termination factor Rho [Actinomycetota bacterium]